MARSPPKTEVHDKRLIVASVRVFLGAIVQGHHLQIISPASRRLLRPQSLVPQRRQPVAARTGQRDIPSDQLLEIWQDIASDPNKPHVLQGFVPSKTCAKHHSQPVPCFKPTTNPQLDAERTALGKISPQVDAEKVLNASPFTPQCRFTIMTVYKSTHHKRAFLQRR